MHVSSQTERIQRALHNHDLRLSIRATYQKVLFMAVHFTYSIIQTYFPFTHYGIAITSCSLESWPASQWMLQCLGLQAAGVPTSWSRSSSMGIWSKSALERCRVFRYNFHNGKLELVEQLPAEWSEETSMWLKPQPSSPQLSKSKYAPSQR
jgi:hypothetical protein